MNPKNRPTTTVLPNGRIVTLAMKWWVENSDFKNRDRLYCIHNKNLLTGCNHCIDQRKGKDI